MKIGIVPINVGFSAPGPIAQLAKKAEEVGVESIWTFEHTIIPISYESKYPYSKSGKMPATPETPFVDPLIALSFVAATTTKLRLGTGVNILPQANPLLAAKQIASLDVVSGGRLLVGVGIGWLREEYEAMGVPFERRGTRFADYLTAMKKVWSGGVVEHESEFLRWRSFKSFPLPVQRPHPPILIGGTSAAAFRRVARHGSGWFAPNRNVGQLAELLDQLRQTVREHDRDPDEIEITAFWSRAKEPDELPRYRDLGVSRLVVPWTTLGSGPIASLDALAEDVLTRI